MLCKEPNYLFVILRRGLNRESILYSLYCAMNYSIYSLYCTAVQIGGQPYICYAVQTRGLPSIRQSSRRPGGDVGREGRRREGRGKLYYVYCAMVQKRANRLFVVISNGPARYPLHPWCDNRQLTAVF